MINDESNSNGGMTNDQNSGWICYRGGDGGREVGVRAQAVVASGGINGGAVVRNSLTVGTLNSGTTLQVSGAVSADGRYVTGNVDVQSSVLDGIDTFVIPGTAVNGGAGMRTSVINAIPFRPAQVGCVVIVDHDKGLLEDGWRRKSDGFEAGVAEDGGAYETGGCDEVGKILCWGYGGWRRPGWM